MTATHRLPDQRTPVLLSAHAEELVRADAAALLGYLDRHPAATVGAVAAQLWQTRRIRRHRTVIRAADRTELIAGLAAVATAEHHGLVAHSSAAGATRLAFVFPGQGNQWPGMGAPAYRQLADYRSAVDGAAAAFGAAGQPSPLRYLLGDAEQYSEIEIEGAQFLHAVGLAQVWRSCGIAPDLTVGHSLGEVAAAHVAGALSLPHAVAVIAARAGVVDRLPGRYAVAALGVTPAAARDLITHVDGWLELSVVNAATSVAVSGDRDAVLAAVAAVADRGQFAREISVGFPVHTSVLEPLRDDLRAQLPDAEFADTAIQFVGAAIGDVVTPGTRFADYWYGNLRDMVRFDRAVAAAVRCGAGAFAEMSAHPSLLHAIADVAGDPGVLVGSGRRDAPLADTLAGNITAAAVADPGYDWRALTDMSAQGLRGFPNAPMRRVHLWARPEPFPARPGVTVAVQRWRRIDATHAGPGPRTVAVVGAGSHADALRSEFTRSGHLVACHDAELLVVVAPPFDNDDAPAAAAELAGLVGDGLLDYVASIGARCRGVALVTSGAEQVGAQDPPPALGHAALAAMHRSVGLEHPELNWGHLDLPAAGADPSAVATTLLSDTGFCALRPDGRGTARWRPALSDAPAATPWALDSGVLDDVVITGGTGVIGLHYARHLAARGARRIVLLGRRGLDASALRALTDEYGTQFLAPPCDITDPDQLAAVAAEHGAASLLIHAAGAVTFATAAELTAAACADTFAAKVTGLTRMVQCWPLRPDARILLCSSVSGLWGGRGHTAYAAANRMLDVLAARLRADGRQCVAIRWGLWPGETGIVDAAEIANIERAGLQQMAPESAIAASLCDHGDDPLVFAADADRLRLFLGTEPHDATPHEAAPADHTAGAEDTVRAELASVLRLPDGGAFDLDTELFDLGVDSLLAVDLRKRLKRRLGRTVALATLLGGITAGELVCELEKVDIARD